MRSKEKIAEEIVLIRYYNVLFYLFLAMSQQTVDK